MKECNHKKHGSREGQMIHNDAISPYLLTSIEMMPFLFFFSPLLNKLMLQHNTLLGTETAGMR
jgi:hypothetical protein